MEKKFGSVEKMTPERFWMDVVTVVSHRVTTLPVLWLSNPFSAAMETRKMFSEKDDALRALQQQLMLAPTMFWCDAWTGLLKGDVDCGMNRARQAAEQRMAHPYTSRVSANRQRLSNRR